MPAKKSTKDKDKEHKAEHKSEHKPEQKSEHKIEHKPEQKAEHKPEHKPAAKKAAVQKKKTAAHAAAEAHPAEPAAELEKGKENDAAVHEPKAQGKPGKYFYAVGRRKTSVANIRMFSGKAEHKINKKNIDAYFGMKGYVDEALKPLQLTGLENQVYIYANVKGGGTHSQAQAVAHGLAQAITASNEDFRKVLKKNGMLTRDSRMKERKKPGLKRARRGPQWAKR